MHEQGAVHRNIRPSSIYVTEGMDVVLADAASSLMVRDLALRARSSQEYVATLGCCPVETRFHFGLTLPCSWQVPELAST